MVLHRPKRICCAFLCARVPPLDGLFFFSCIAGLVRSGYSHRGDLRTGLQQRAAQAAGQASVMVVKLRWGALADRMYVKARTGKSKEELDARAARRNRTDPYEEKKYRGSGIKEVQAWWKKCQDWMAHFKEQSEPFVFDFKKLLMALSDKEAVAQSEVDAFMENCAKRWQTREGTYQLKRRRLKPDVRDSPEYPGTDIDMADI